MCVCVHLLFKCIVEHSLADFAFITSLADPSTAASPARAGDTLLLSLFSEHAVVLLQSRSTRKNLRIANGEVEGLGGQGVYGKQFQGAK